MLAQSASSVSSSVSLMLDRAAPSAPIDVPIVSTGGGGKSAIAVILLEGKNCSVVFL